MVFTRKNGDFHGRTVSFREGSVHFFLGGDVVQQTSLGNDGFAHFKVYIARVPGPRKGSALGREMPLFQRNLVS